MKYGMNMLLWTDRIDDSHLPILEELKRLGYDGVELPVFDMDTKYFAQLGQQLDSLGLERTAVTVRGEAANPISPDPAIRRAGIEENKRVIDCCQAAGVEILVGPYHSALGLFSGAGPTQDEWSRGVESMREVADHAAAAHVTLGLEYLNRFECYLLNTAADTIRFVNEVDHPACGMMYDTFHSHIEEKDPVAAIKTCAPRTVHVHISENDRSTPGSGCVHWDATFDALKETGYDGWFMIEAFGLALPSLVAATKIWRRMYQDEMQLARDGLNFMRDNWQRRS